MKALVAGGAGFIGSHLVDALLAENYEVVCVDNFFIGTKENIAHLKDHPRFKFYEQDLSDFDGVLKIFEEEQVDHVFHMAANSDIQASAKASLDTFWDEYRRLTMPHRYKVDLSDELYNLKQELLRRRGQWKA